MPEGLVEPSRTLHASPAMDIVLRGSDGIRMLAVTGEIDMLTGPAFEASLSAQLALRPRHLVVDLAEVSFFGSHGIRTLLVAAEAAADTTALHVGVGGNRIIERTLQITGLSEVLDVHADTPALVLALRDRADELSGLG